MTRHVILLRGVNVGGKNRLPMKDFAALLEAAGAADVKTYIQSGNAAFELAPSKAKKLAKAVQDGLRDELGLDVPVVVRAAAELEAAIAACPFDTTDDKAVHVGFMTKTPTPAKVAALDPDRSPGDHFAVVGAQVYLHCPNGVARTKLTNAWFDKSLGVVSTFRNWRTTQKLWAMCNPD